MNASRKTILLAAIASGYFLMMGGNALAGTTPVPNSQHESQDPCVDGIRVTVQGIMTAREEFGPTIFSDSHNVRWKMVTLKVSHATTRKILSKMKGCFDEHSDFSRIQLRQVGNSYIGYLGKRVQVIGLLRGNSGDPVELLPMVLQVSHISLLQHSL